MSTRGLQCLGSFSSSAVLDFREKICNWDFCWKDIKSIKIINSVYVNCNNLSSMLNMRAVVTVSYRSSEWLLFKICISKPLFEFRNSVIIMFCITCVTSPRLCVEHSCIQLRHWLCCFVFRFATQRDPGSLFTVTSVSISKTTQASWITWFLFA